MEVCIAISGDEGRGLWGCEQDDCFALDIKDSLVPPQSKVLLR